MHWKGSKPIFRCFCLTTFKSQTIPVMKNFPAIFFLFFILFQSCSEDEEDRNGICTDEYRTIVVSITDSQGVPVALDDFKVVVLKNGRDITIELTDATFQFMRERGTYPIFSDKYHEEYRQQE